MFRWIEIAVALLNFLISWCRRYTFRRKEQPALRAFLWTVAASVVRPPVTSLPWQSRATSWRCALKMRVGSDNYSGVLFDALFYVLVYAGFSEAEGLKWCTDQPWSIYQIYVCDWQINGFFAPHTCYCWVFVFSGMLGVVVTQSTNHEPYIPQQRY